MNKHDNKPRKISDGKKSGGFERFIKKVRRKLRRRWRMIRKAIIIKTQSKVSEKQEHNPLKKRQNKRKLKKQLFLTSGCFLAYHAV